MIREDSKFLLEDVGGTALLIPLNTKVVDLNCIVTLNTTGRYLWDLLANEQSLEDLALALSESFVVKITDARNDAQAFVDSISPLGLLR